MPAPFASNDTAIVRRSPWIRPSAAAIVAIWAVGALAVGVLVGQDAAGKLTYALVVAVTALTAVWAVRKREVMGRVEAGEQGLSFDGDLLVPRAQIKNARMTLREGGLASVRVERRWARPALEVRVSSVEEGRALVRALDGEAARSAPSFQVRPAALALRRASTRAFAAGAAAFVSFFVVALCSVAANAPSFVLGFLPFWLAGMGLFAGLPLVATKIEVGHDGLHFTWCGSRRFIPYIDVRIVYGLVSEERAARSMPPYPYEGVKLFLSSHEAVELRSDEADLIYHLVSEAVDAWWRRDGSVKTALVQRGPHEPEAWLRELASLGARAAHDYRNASIAEELWRVLEDVAAPADARAGAAVALRRSLGDEGKSRLRRAASLTAEPRLRFAIDAAASDTDDAALIAALAEVEADGGREAVRGRRSS